MPLTLHNKYPLAPLPPTILLFTFALQTRPFLNPKPWIILRKKRVICFLWCQNKWNSFDVKIMHEDTWKKNQCIGLQKNDCSFFYPYTPFFWKILLLFCENILDPGSSSPLPTLLYLYTILLLRLPPPAPVFITFLPFYMLLWHGLQ